jgi:hypothetical protein
MPKAPTTAPESTGSKGKRKVINHKEYNASLCARGSLVLWVSPEVLKQWKRLVTATPAVGEYLYPSSIIECCLLVRKQYKQALRQTTGLMKSILKLAGLEQLPIPNYTTLCRRQKGLPVEVSKRLEQDDGKPLNIIIDSTGLKVYGEGEWKVRRHGWSKHRTWRKLHVAIDADTQEIVAVELTPNDAEGDDAKTAVKMLEGKIHRLKSFRGDGAYDSFELRKALGKDVEQVIPPPRGAKVHLPRPHAGPNKGQDMTFLSQRNEAVRVINGHGRKHWKQKTRYHRRSLSETAMFRYKTSFTGQLSARKIENQLTEVKIGAKILNVYRTIGMPISVPA